MKLGIFGGSFDPVHHGHLIVAEYVRELAGLDRVLFVPTMISPHKAEAEATEAVHRLAMLREAVKDNPFFEILDIEIERGGISYTIDTLRLMKEGRTSDEFFLMIGADNVRDFRTWKEPGEIVKQARLIVMNRPGFSAQPDDPELPADVIRCTVPAVDISATEIRRRVMRGLPISYLVPPSVSSYIDRHRLYRTTGGTAA
jgi:nicotinate-nucleotide adenylyltransferase